MISAGYTTSKAISIFPLHTFLEPLIVVRTSFLHPFGNSEALFAFAIIAQARYPLLRTAAVHKNTPLCLGWHPDLSHH
ncbi:hypothetical protein OKW21_000550 [Catalinimonas alkaloidigena]|uniref:hypothetical protein n=1 Tax=Catalinimonas alkaloidigena TaxID=1075417 RepID=UPI002406BCE8|nr:hypothetical protein [Catalinimonas alkaloidigena]MDF9795287.1 hypothetical protein [Catalinimonas alkaloidigena]